MEGDVVKYITKPVPVEATQIHHFYVWASFLNLLRWGVPCYFVPKGHTHPLRTPHEIDRNDEPLSEATAFIVIRNTTGTNLRANPGHYVVKSADGFFCPVDAVSFKESYVEGTVL